MTAAIYFHPEAYTTTGPKLMGRNAAGESFIRGFLEHSSERSTIYAQVETAEHGAAFQELAAKYNRSGEVETFTRSELIKAKSPGVVFHPGPGINKPAFDRSVFGDNSWALCGITHTTSSANAMDSIADILTAPIQPWDALICPSNAVKKNVETVLQAQANYLKERLGITNLVLPLLPVIPLGIHTKDFRPSSDKRILAREQLDIKPDDIVVLYTGRLSFHAKANPLPMYQALESAYKLTKKSIVLIECGWHSNEFIKNAFTQASNVISPSVKTILVDGRNSNIRSLAWACADIFCSLPDNIQETFGIVPLEAMSAGLPVIVSDWNGYKDSVRDGLDGFRIATTAPAPGSTQDLADRYALSLDSYDRYIGYSSSLVGVDLVKLTDSFCQLINSKDLRIKMGLSGLERSTSLYDWKYIINKYEELWREQQSILNTESGAVESMEDGGHPRRSVRKVWPARLDPSVSFAHYSTYHVTETTMLSCNFASYEEAIERLTTLRGLDVVEFADAILPRDEDIQSLLHDAASVKASKFPASIIISCNTDIERHKQFRSLSWLLKMGFFFVP